MQKIYNQDAQLVHVRKSFPHSNSSMAATPSPPKQTSQK